MATVESSWQITNFPNFFDQQAYANTYNQCCSNSATPMEYVEFALTHLLGTCPTPLDLLYQDLVRGYSRPMSSQRGLNIPFSSLHLLLSFLKRSRLKIFQNTLKNGEVNICQVSLLWRSNAIPSAEFHAAQRKLNRNPHFKIGKINEIFHRSDPVLALERVWILNGYLNNTFHLHC